MLTICCVEEINLLPGNRKKIIMDELSIKGKVEILELVDLLDVSAMTIRRDLDELEKNKKLIRTHGGAALPQVIRIGHSFEPNLSENDLRKKEISKIAVTLVRDGVTVLLDSGTTTLEIAKLLKARCNLTIVTNDIKIATELTNSNLEVILLGGKVQTEDGVIVGSFAENMLENMFVDILFLSAHAVDAVHGITSANFEKASIKRAMIHNSEVVYLIVDAQKFGKKAFSKIADLDSITGIITDSTISKEEEDILKRKSKLLKGETKERDIIKDG